MARIPARVLTEERVAEINECIQQGSRGGPLGSVVGDDSLRTTKVTYADRAVWLSAKFGSAADRFASSRDLRCISGECANDDPMRYGGLNPLITTLPVPIGRTPPRFIDTNAKVMKMDLGVTLGVQVLFLPDVLLLYRGKRYEVVSYEALSVGGGAVLCAERSPHKAAEVVGHTWVHTNLDGGRTDATQTTCGCPSHATIWSPSSPGGGLPPAAAPAGRELRCGHASVFPGVLRSQLARRSAQYRWRRLDRR